MFRLYLMILTIKQRLFLYIELPDWSSKWNAMREIYFTLDNRRSVE